MIYLFCKYFPLLQDFLLHLVLILPGLRTFSDEGFIDPPPKKAKINPAPVALEASAPATTPSAQVSTTSSLSKGKEIPSTAAITASPPPEKPVSSLCFDNTSASNSPRVFLGEDSTSVNSYFFLLLLGSSNCHFCFGGLCLSIHFARG
jgi:hypothetical protein